MEVKKFGKAYNIHVVCAYGGGNMHEQQRACEEGPEVIVATPVSSSQFNSIHFFHNSIKTTIKSYKTTYTHSHVVKV